MNHPRIGFLACPDTLPGSPTRRPDAFEHDEQIGALIAGLAGRADVAAIDWHAPLDQLIAFDALLIGSAWDYTEHKPAFLAKIAALEAAGVLVLNPTAMVAWNADKLYLQDIATRGAASIPTLWPEAPDEAEVRAAFDHFACERVIVKRRVGAGAIGQFSFTRDDPALTGWRMEQPAMIQPFLASIESEGEHSFIFVDGAFSHALMKRAAPGDYRIQSLYGGIEVAMIPPDADIAAAAGVIAMLPFDAPPLYARIDMVRRDDGALALIEAELIEPYLYPLQGPAFGQRLADAVLARLPSNS
jgi:hypothetical protein